MNTLKRRKRLFNKPCIISETQQVRKSCELVHFLTYGSTTCTCEVLNEAPNIFSFHPLANAIIDPDTG